MSRILQSLVYHHPQRHGVKHILMVELLPGPVLGQVDLKLWVFGDTYPRYLLFTCPAIPADRFFNRLANRDFPNL